MLQLSLRQDIDGVFFQAHLWVGEYQKNLLC